jgi:hypothetical protein
MGRAILGALALLVSGSAALACGTERWPVKTGTDRDAGSVVNLPKPTTIAQLRLIVPPAHCIICLPAVFVRYLSSQTSSMRQPL